MAKNLFIALEGIDGSGKSTQIKLLAAAMGNAGHKTYVTFEPTDGMIGSVLRNILRGNIKADHRTIAGLFLADRLDHLLNEETGIVKKMQDGYTVITDRYYFSSYAYHSVHMDMDWVMDANKICTQILKPDLNIFIDVPPEVCMQRITAGRNNTELFETLENLKSVREKYIEAFEKSRYTESISVINGNRAADAIADDIRNSIMVFNK